MKNTPAKKNPKKSLLGIVVAILLVIGAATGILPLDELQGMDFAATNVITQDQSGDEVLAEQPTEKPTAEPTADPTAKPTEKPTAEPTAKPAATAKPTAKPTATPKPTEKPTEAPSGPIIDPQGIADYLFEHGCLPDNFITKSEAQALGWDSSENYLSDVAPGMSIGGDRFGNYEGILPKAKGRQYYEADCYYEGGKRNAYRIVYSNDGLVFYTSDHYETFTEMKPSR